MDVERVRQPEPMKKNVWQFVTAPLKKAVTFWQDVWAHFTQPSLPKMVNWYSPTQLFHTAIETVISSILGRHADRRALEAANKEARFFDFSFTASKPTEKELIKHEIFTKENVKADVEAKALWIDYVSDLGDGFNSTYAVAYKLAQPEIRVNGLTETLPRGDLLIFGGDEVYPTAHRAEYKRRLIEPYKAAMRDKPLQDPFLFALPGNHDWYDSLSAFIEFFGDADVHSFADNKWRVPQNRSYFAIKLPKKWWLLGVDFQLESDLDHWQIKYFENIVNQYMEPGDRIILCCAEPYWVFEKLDPALEKKNRESNLNLLLEILKTKKGETDKAEEEEAREDKEIALYLAGDIHHYFRVLEKDRKEKKQTDAPPLMGGFPGALPARQQAKKLPDILKITSGGGGAFLHPTHGAIPKAFAAENYRTHSYPPPRDSWWLGWLNFLFPLLNRSFGLVPGTLYLLLCLFFFQASHNQLNFLDELERANTFLKALPVMLQITMHSPLLSIFVCLLLVGFIVFGKAEGNATWFAVGVGGLHGLAHFLTPLCMFYWGWPLARQSWLWLLTFWLAIFAGGWFIGSFLVGVYLFLAVNLFGQHPTLGFSSLRIQDWKNFVRMKIDLETGALTIYPLGIHRVPRQWDLEMGHHTPRNEAEFQVELIEGPIVITPDKAHLGGFGISIDGAFQTPEKRGLRWIQRNKRILSSLTNELWKRHR